MVLTKIPQTRWPTQRSRHAGHTPQNGVPENTGLKFYVLQVRPEGKDGRWTCMRLSTVYAKGGRATPTSQLAAKTDLTNKAEWDCLERDSRERALEPQQQANTRAQEKAATTSYPIKRQTEAPRASYGPRPNLGVEPKCLCARMRARGADKRKNAY